MPPRDSYRLGRRGLPQDRRFQLCHASRKARRNAGRPPHTEIPIKRRNLRLTCSFVYEVLATFKAVRHFLRANPELRAQGCPYPEYSPQFERMIAFVQDMRSEPGHSR